MRSVGVKLAVAGVLVLILAGAFGWLFNARTDDAQASELIPSSPVGLLSDEDLVGFPRITGPRRFDFPRDHGPHPEYRHEWWYLTGNLAVRDGREFGYQITFFRFAISPREAKSPSAWSTNQVYMAHVALTDVQKQRFHNFERFSRGALGLAGAQSTPFRLWIDDWDVLGTESLFPLQVRIAEDAISLKLRLDSRKPIVLQGDRGYSRKGDAAGNASHYYSFTRLQTTGEITVDGATHQVIGESWLDREWGSSALSADFVGWDWFSLQLDDGRELMFFHLRHADGSVDLLSHGSLVAADGQVQPLTIADVEAWPSRWWRSADGKHRYPVAWQLRLPEEGLELMVTPRLDQQEWQGAFRYWEGAVEVSGTAHGQPVAGQGYLELTGY